MTYPVSRWRFPLPGVRFRLEYKPVDLWVGAYYASESVEGRPLKHLWICFLPCFPVHIILGDTR